MYENLFRDSSFYHTLHRRDRELSAEMRAEGCQDCGAKLHSARYKRKPRGGPEDLTPEDKLHHSLCCSRRGCRKRHNPPSLRFLGRRHYVSMAVTLASAMVIGITEKSAREMNELIGVSIRTLRRWREWWREVFPETPFWNQARARFAGRVELAQLPASLVERFRGALRDRATRLLRFLSPLTATGPGEAG